MTSPFPYLPFIVSCCISKVHQDRLIATYLPTYFHYSWHFMLRISVFAISRFTPPRRKCSPFFAIISCRSFLNKLSHLKSFTVFSKLGIVFLNASWLHGDKPNSVTFPVGYQSSTGTADGPVQSKFHTFCVHQISVSSAKENDRCCGHLQKSNATGEELLLMGYVTKPMLTGRRDLLGREPSGETGRLYPQERLHAMHQQNKNVERSDASLFGSSSHKYWFKQH